MLAVETGIDQGEKMREAFMPWQKGSTLYREDMTRNADIELGDPGTRRRR
jgi:hypothetical protein